MRYYEDAGLIVPGRCGNGFRDYCRSTVDRVLVVRSLLESGLPVRLIREILPGSPEESEVGAVRAEFLRAVQDHRDRLAPASPSSATSGRRSTPTCARTGAPVPDRA